MRGTLFSTSLYQSIRPVHPRTCGENLNPLWFDTSNTRSPPHIRGTLDALEIVYESSPFTPAPAGNTTSPSNWRQDNAVHPRTCGEHNWFMTHAKAPGRSPPHMRGTPLDDVLSEHTSPFTPAHAGNTWTGTKPHCPEAVHPRTCGEHTSM